MGKIVEKAKKKKKGRPSLLDLQKRTVRQQQQQQQQQQRLEPNPNPNSNPNSNRRSTRRNPNSAGISPAPDRIYREQDEDDDDDDDSGGSSNGKRKEKKLKLVLRLPPHQQNANCTSSLKSEDEKGEEAPLKRRKINAVVGVRSGFPDGEEGGNDLNNATKTIDPVLGKALEPGPTTPLPDKKLLVFILDRIQKKDTYGVFSEPVDPNELPDYHDIIEHPMDFSTVRNKLSGGAYAFLEQFEKDVFLICSNAMKYNASDTIYFRQARAIQELAKKNFENLRQDSDDNEPEPKLVRRGRPPTKNLKRPIGRPPLDWAGSELSSDAVLANNGDDPTSSYSHDLRKSSYPEKSGPTDQSGRTFTVSRNSEERKPERNDEFPATMSKNFSTKFGKKHFIFDENRRNTCKQFLTSLGHEQTVLNTFDGQKKQLTAVGLHSEHGFARSVARFAADLGPIIWKIASKKIERALPAQTMFGPGWVGEKDTPLSRPLIYTSSTAQALVFQQSISLPKTSSTSVPCTSDPKADKFAKKQEFLSNSNPEVHSNGTTSPCAFASSSCAVATESHEPNAGRLEAAGDLNCENGFGALKSFPSGIKPTPSQIQPRPFLNSGMNGFSCSFRFNLASQMAKFATPGLAAGSFNREISMRPQMLEMVSRGSNNFVCPFPANHLDSGHRNLPEGPSTVASDSAGEAKEIAGAGFQDQPQQQSSFPGLSQHQKLDPVPPDLNLRFHSPGSPSCSQQPDLAL